MPNPIWSSSIDRVEAGVRRIARRHEDLPVDLIVLSRLIVGLGRDLTANTEELLQPLSLGEGELRVLMLLFGQPDGTANAGDLVISAAHSPANITRIADSLLERGLITREPSADDRRCVLLKLTRRGETLVRNLLPKLSARARQAFAGLSAADIRRLGADLRRVAATLCNAARRVSAARETPQ